MSSEEPFRDKRSVTRIHAAKDVIQEDQLLFRVDGSCQSLGVGKSDVMLVIVILNHNLFTHDALPLTTTQVAATVSNRSTVSIS